MQLNIIRSTAAPRCSKKTNNETIEDPSVPIDESKFYLQNQRFMLTYRSHLNKEGFIAWFTSTFGTMDFIRLAHEMGDTSHDYEHTHVVVDFGKRFQSRNCRIFDFDNIHPNIRIIKTKSHFLNSKRYLSKEDPENDDLKIKPTLYEKVSACENINEVLNMAQRPSDVPGLNMMYEIIKQNQTVVFDFDLKKINRWQRQLYEIIKLSPFVEDVPIDPLDGIESDLETCMREWTRVLPGPRNGPDRLIRLIYDPPGSAGKTVFGKALWASDPKKYVTLQGVASIRDIATQFETILDSGWNGHCVFINITRECQDHKIYTSIEAVRDGLLTTQKFRGRPLGFNLKHMVLFTNFMPKLTGVTLNRWKIHGLDQYLLLTDIDTNDAMRIYDQEQEEKLDKINYSEMLSTAKAERKAFRKANTGFGGPVPTWEGIA